MGGGTEPGSDPVAHDGIGDGDCGHDMRCSGRQPPLDAPLAAIAGIGTDGRAATAALGAGSAPAALGDVRGDGGGWDSPAQAAWRAATLRFVSATEWARLAMLRLIAATTEASDSKVRGAPPEDAEERPESAGVAEDAAGGAAEKVAEGTVERAVEGGMEGTGGEPDISDTKLLGAVVLAEVDRRE